MATNETIEVPSSSVAEPTEGGPPIVLIAGVGGGVLLIIVAVVVIIIIKKKRAAAEKAKLEGGKTESPGEDVNVPEEKEKVNEDNLLGDKQKEEAFGGTGNISIIFKQDTLNDSPDKTITNELTLDRTNRKLIDNNSHLIKNNDPNYNRVVALFSEKLKGIQKDHKEMNILEEIKLMKSNRQNQPKRYVNGVTPTPVDDKSSIGIVESEKSHVSGVSASRMAKKQSHINVVCYTDENREEPDDVFYNQNIEEMKEEKKQLEKEEEEAKKTERELEEKYQRKLQKMAEEDDEVAIYLDEGEVGKRALEVKDHAIMTDFSQPKNVEILKNSKIEFKNAV